MSRRGARRPHVRRPHSCPNDQPTRSVWDYTVNRPQEESRTEKLQREDREREEELDRWWKNSRNCDH